MRKVYISANLADSPQDFKDMVSKLKEKLKEEYEILDAQKSLPRSDFVIAICDHSSIDVGYDMATALEKYSKPTLGLAKAGMVVTRLVEGIDHPMYIFKTYNTVEDIETFIKEKELKHFKPAVPVEVCGT